MRDVLGRNIDYLRISVTDKCNLRCKYCMPPQGILPVAHEEILTLEEIFRLVSIMEQLGIRKVRLTGGEPMVRKNLPWLVEQIHGLSGIREIAMTTNGTLFAPLAEVYRKAGLTAVNISLDTLDQERFRCITGCDRGNHAAGVDSVLHAIDAALERQLRVKAVKIQYHIRRGLHTEFGHEVCVRHFEGDRIFLDFHRDPPNIESAPCSTK